ncbi:hypothetical protein ACJX0J_023633, partial [Zea mays]
KYDKVADSKGFYPIILFKIGPSIYEKLNRFMVPATTFIMENTYTVYNFDYFICMQYNISDKVSKRKISE